jgi:hypothetical protein
MTCILLLLKSLDSTLGGAAGLGPLLHFLDVYVYIKDQTAHRNGAPAAPKPVDKKHETKKRV